MIIEHNILPHSHVDHNQNLRWFGTYQLACHFVEDRSVYEFALLAMRERTMKCETAARVELKRRVEWTVSHWF